MGEPLCEFCGVVRAVVYCKADSAGLCLQCDVYVHAANIISRRHLRSLICDKCGSQVAAMHCFVDKMSFCDACGGSSSCCCFRQSHRLVRLSFYNGCPSQDELSRLWSFGFDSGDQQEWASSGGMMTNRLNEFASSVKIGSWDVQMPLPDLQSSYISSCGIDQRLTSFNMDQEPLFSQMNTLQKVI